MAGVMAERLARAIAAAVLGAIAGMVVLEFMSARPPGVQDQVVVAAAEVAQAIQLVALALIDMLAPVAEGLGFWG
jgi:hypothetical protein